MTKTLIGLDYLGVPCVKIAKGNIDPVTTPDSQVSAWFYNSKWSADVAVQVTITPLPYYTSTGGDGNYFVRVPSAGGQNNMYLSNAYFGGILYGLPLFDMKPTHYSTGRFQDGRTVLTTRGYGDRGGRWRTSIVGVNGGEWYKDWDPSDTGAPSYWPYGVYLQQDENDSNSRRGWRAGLVVWRLPGDETPILDGTPKAPVPGQVSIEITSQHCRVAKPGYDVRTATQTQLAFDSSKRPPKIIAAADIAVPAGVSSYDTGITLPSGSIPDVYFYTGSELYFPTNPTDFEKGAEYWISGSSIIFNNPNGACRARFIIIAGENAPPTFGANDVLRQFDVGGQNVVQFLRPGAGPNPNFNDIILDSRWPSLQIIKEGFISIGNGALQHVVPIDTAGLFPIVKYMTVHGAGNEISTSWSKFIRPPVVSRIGLYRAGWQSMMDGGDSTYCRVTATEARFFTFRGNPVWQWYSNAQAFDQNNPSYEYDPYPLYGIRYYIFGIPA